MSGADDRLSRLSPEQRLLLEKRLMERGITTGDKPAGSGPSPSTGASAAGDGDWRLRTPSRRIGFSLYFFSDDGSRESGAKYRLALEAARFADENEFDAVWTPERHFQTFGGLYPNPSVLGAALAAITRRVGIRAGSVALPLHNPVRVAEEWSVVDNLSGGRVAVSFASGWHPDDFVLFPSSYEDRKDVMFRGIETIRRLWAGETLTLTAASGAEVAVRTLPRPVQKELPIWVTTAGSIETWEKAGSIGAGVLAALVGYDPQELAEQIRRYRHARAAAGHEPGKGIVTLVAHTFVGTDDAAVRELVREPMTGYLKNYLKQFQKLGLEEAGATDRDERDVAALAFEHYFAASTLLGTQAKCARVLDSLAAAGADEVACLIDFGLDTDTVLGALPKLAELAAHYASAPTGRDRDTGLAPMPGAEARSATGP